MDAVAVGQLYDPEVISWPEGCLYNYDISGHWLHYLYRNPTVAEIASIMTGPAQFALFIQYPVIFLLHQFGQMPWNDAPYSWGLVPEESRRLPELDPSLHALLKIIMVNSETGIVVALRALTFSGEFTYQLHRAIKAQASLHWDSELHYKTIKSVYQTLTPEEMVQRAGTTCKGGD
ncbi:MAG: hypothetical protein ACLQPD_26285 [Desulfomonilaceae bacterium]